VICAGALLPALLVSLPLLLGTDSLGVQLVSEMPARSAAAAATPAFAVKGEMFT
jgi:hypothetical protein